MNHRKMPSLSEMERIEQSLLGEKLDEMLDRIEKEDIAYVITEGEDTWYSSQATSIWGIAILSNFAIVLFPALMRWISVLLKNGMKK